MVDEEKKDSLVESEIPKSPSTTDTGSEPFTISAEASLQSLNEGMGILELRPKNVVDLIRSNKEVAEAMTGDEKPEYSFQSGSQRIEVIGGKHEYNDMIRLDNLVKQAVNSGEDTTLFVERSSDQLELIKAIPANTPPAEVAKKYSEQGYIAWRALQQGIKVRGWDIPITEQFKIGLKTNSPSEVVEYFVANRLVSNYLQFPNGIPLEELRSYGPDLLRIQNIIDAPLLTSIYIKVCGVEIDLRKPDALLTIPYEVLAIQCMPPQNKVAGEITHERDRHAVQQLEAAKKDGAENIVVTCGANHAAVWRLALEALYSPEKAA